jgi:hypothetical protein
VITGLATWFHGALPLVLEKIDEVCNSGFLDTEFFLTGMKNGGVNAL